MRFVFIIFFILCCHYRVVETMRVVTNLLFACLALQALADDNAVQLEETVGTLVYGKKIFLFCKELP